MNQPKRAQHNVEAQITEALAWQLYSHQHLAGATESVRQAAWQSRHHKSRFLSNQVEWAWTRQLEQLRAEFDRRKAQLVPALLEQAQQHTARYDFLHGLGRAAGR